MPSRKPRAAKNEPMKTGANASWSRPSLASAPAVPWSVTARERVPYHQCSAGPTSAPPSSVNLPRRAQSSSARPFFFSISSWAEASPAALRAAAVADLVASGLEASRER